MKIYKYPLKRQEGDQEVDLPGTSQILSFGHDPEGQLCIWAAVEPTSPTRTRTLHLAMTGGEAPMINLEGHRVVENGKAVASQLAHFLGTSRLAADAAPGPRVRPWRPRGPQHRFLRPGSPGSTPRRHGRPAPP